MSSTLKLANIPNDVVHQSSYYKDINNNACDSPYLAPMTIILPSECEDEDFTNDWIQDIHDGATELSKNISNISVQFLSRKDVDKIVMLMALIFTAVMLYLDYSNNFRFQSIIARYLMQ
jgi:hypothetical protein